MPVAVDTIGPLVEDAHRFIKQIGNSWMREKIDTGILSFCIGAYPSGDSAHGPINRTLDWQPQATQAVGRGTFAV